MAVKANRPPHAGYGKHKIAPRTKSGGVNDVSVALDGGHLASALLAAELQISLRVRRIELNAQSHRSLVNGPSEPVSAASNISDAVAPGTFMRDGPLGDTAIAPLIETR